VYWDTRFNLSFPKKEHFSLTRYKLKKTYISQLMCLGSLPLGNPALVRQNAKIQTTLPYEQSNVPPAQHSDPHSVQEIANVLHVVDGASYWFGEGSDFYEIENHHENVTFECDWDCPPLEPYGEFIMDLTEYGIEPNPGPSTASEKDAGWHWGDALQMANEARSHVNFGVQDLADSTADWFNYLIGNESEEMQHTHAGGTITHGTRIRPKATPQPLVGVELNPGPVTLPRKGKMVAGPKQAAKKQPVQNRSAPTVREERKTTFRAPSQAAAAYSQGVSSGVPRITPTKDGKLICHRELIAIVNGTTNFTSQTFPIQPGLGAWPWLSTQCNGWEKYRIRKMVATYLTRTGTNTPGTVILAPDYDAADAPPTSELQVSTYNGVEDDAPWKTINMEFDMRRSKELFIRNGPLAPNLDIKTYDFANLFICTMDGTAVNWGKVYIYYEIELINAQAVIVAGGLGGSEVGTTAITTTNPLGTAQNGVAGSYISAVVPNVGNNTIAIVNTVVGAEYVVNAVVAGTGITITAIAATSGFNLKTVLASYSNAAGTAGTVVATYTATATSGLFTFSVTGTTCTAGTFLFMPLGVNAFV
jgi:hypothetical protein